MMYTNVVHRTQILLEKQQYEALKAWSCRADKSLSELVRLAGSRLLGGGEGSGKKLRLSDIRGIGKDPGGLSGRDHDKALYGRPR